MADQVLADNTWVRGVLYEKGSTPPSSVAVEIGDHLWTDKSETESNVAPSGEALRGLIDNTFVDGVLHEKGSFPPAGVAEKIGAHMWVGGRLPVEYGSRPAAPTQSPTVPVQRSVREVEVKDDSAGDESGAQTVDPDNTPAVEPADDAGRSDDERAAPKPPPQGGPRGSAAAWRDYASAVGVEVGSDAKRDDVIDAVRAAGKPVD